MKKSLILGLLLTLFTSSSFATQVDILTNKGTIRVDLADESAPKTVSNFLKYVDDGFYNGTIFHRVIKGFMIQGGGFTPDMGKKDTRPPVPYEGDNGLYNDRGTLAMARTRDPDSATAQFFVNQVTNPFLNHGARGGAGYTVFGTIIQGMDIIDEIADVSTHRVGPYSDVPESPVLIEKVIRVK
ncbi:peptidylprolyl isomerase [Marinomonas balearica]|uniref:Peptidyl-prolyl cis-trans isomerase n=1 Tax=Marinomonas balearica TaxID=491947 RepID=A0A4R6M8E2_9GAMM|nr:peptidylprolyl isomerase [Marinomonas balearica]TDO96439.1 peptidyl-prolyl cis-trans isomerase A (cyclophilin A) [Marinomonas balearica]